MVNSIENMTTATKRKRDLCSTAIMIGSYLFCAYTGGELALLYTNLFLFHAGSMLMIVHREKPFGIDGFPYAIATAVAGYFCYINLAAEMKLTDYMPSIGENTVEWMSFGFVPFIVQSLVMAWFLKKSKA